MIKKTTNSICNVMLSLASLCIVVLLLEIIFRLGNIRGNYMMPRNDSVIVRPSSERLPFGFYPNAIIRSIYPDNPRGYFDKGNSVDHMFNSAGWRDKEHSLTKPQRTFRILGLGDSYLFGQGVRFEDICLSKLDLYLRKRNRSNIVIETINTGISGYNTAHERDLLLTRGLSYEPDIVIVHFVLNDVERDLSKQEPKIEFFANYLSIFMQSDALSQYSYMWSWLRQRYLRHIKGKNYIQLCLDSYLSDQSKIAFVRDSLTDIRNICDKHNAKMLVVIYPFFYNLSGDYPFKPIHDNVRAYCNNNGIPVLDLLSHYRGYDGPELWVHPVDQHPNEVAHDIAARAIHDFLLKHKSYFKLSFL